MHSGADGMSTKSDVTDIIIINQSFNQKVLGGLISGTIPAEIVSVPDRRTDSSTELPKACAVYTGKLTSKVWTTHWSEIWLTSRPVYLPLSVSLSF